MGVQVSRHGYSDDLDHKDLAMWRGRVASAIRGKRGQKLLRDIATYMDAMPVKELASHALVRDDGCVCALGCALKLRGVEVPKEYVGTDDELCGAGEEETTEWAAQVLDIAEPLAKEVSYENDWQSRETPADRWTRMRAWVAERLAAAKPQGAAT